MWACQRLCNLRLLNMLVLLRSMEVVQLCGFCNWPAEWSIRVRIRKGIHQRDSLRFCQFLLHTWAHCMITTWLMPQFRICRILSTTFEGTKRMKEVARPSECLCNHGCLACKNSESYVVFCQRLDEILNVWKKQSDHQSVCVTMRRWPAKTCQSYVVLCQPL